MIPHSFLPSPIRKDQLIESSEQYVLATLEGGRSTLTVRNVGQGDGGPYTCRATNKAGVLESQLLLKVFGERITHRTTVKHTYSFFPPPP